MANGVGKGIVGGAATGAKLGGVAGSVIPGVGNAVGAVAGGVIGAVAGGVKANSSKDKDPNKNLPSLEDPTQTARMLEIDRIAKNIQAGSDPVTQNAFNQNKLNLASTQNRLSRATGGNSGQTVDALLKAQKASDIAGNQALAQGQSRLPFFQNLGQQLSSRASQRALELELLDRGQKSAERAQGQKEQNINKNAAISSGLPGITDAAGRISSLINLGSLGGAEEIGVINPNQNLNQTTISPENANPSINMSQMIDSGQEVATGLNDISSLTTFM